MPYLGKQAEEGGALIRSHEFLQGTDTATGTTAFTVASSGGDYVRVFLNGVLLQEGASNDYTKTTSAVTIVGTAPADGDILKIDVYESITIWDTVSAASGGTFSGNVSFGDNNITNVGDISLDTISSDAGASIGVTLGTDAGDDFNVGSGKLLVEGDTGLVSIGTGGDFETSTTGKIKQKGSFMQSSTHQAMVLGG